MGTAQYGLDFTGPNNIVTANLDFTVHGWTSTTGSVSADRTEGRVTPSLRTSAQSRYVVAPQKQGVADWSAQWPGPIVGAGMPGLIAACAGLLAFARPRRQRIVRSATSIEQRRAGLQHAWLWAARQGTVTAL